jgi:cobalt-zinc-cadmium efflux system protein
MHGHAHPPTGRILNWSLIATVIFVGIEIIAGVRAHSLALLSDAGHNATDALALLLAWFGLRQETRPPDQQKTFGYHRAGVLTAFFNAVTLVLVSAWIFYESVIRLVHPEPVNDVVMIITAMGGIVLNGGVVYFLHQTDHGNDLNLRSALIHMLGDLVGSAAIVLGAVILRFTGWMWIDPVLSIAIAALIVWSAWDIISESLNILLEALPRGLNLVEVKEAIRLQNGVLDVHDLHIWSLGSKWRALSCHILIEDVPPSASNSILQRLQSMLADRFKIHHTTVQFEHLNCASSEEVCSGHGLEHSLLHRHHHPHQHP